MSAVDFHIPYVCTCPVCSARAEVDSWCKRKLDPLLETRSAMREPIPDVQEVLLRVRAPTAMFGQRWSVAELGLFLMQNPTAIIDCSVQAWDEPEDVHEF